MGWIDWTTNEICKLIFILIFAEFNFENFLNLKEQKKSIFIILFEEVVEANFIFFIFIC